MRSMATMGAGGWLTGTWQLGKSLLPQPSCIDLVQCPATEEKYNIFIAIWTKACFTRSTVIVMLFISAHSVHLTSHTCVKSCLDWMDVTWPIASCHVAWDDRDVVDCAGLKWGQVKWCSAFQCGILHLSYRPIEIWRNLNIIPLWEPHHRWFLYGDRQWHSVNCGVNCGTAWWTWKVYRNTSVLHIP